MKLIFRKKKIQIKIKSPCHFWQRGKQNFRSTIDFVWDYKSLAVRWRLQIITSGFQLLEHIRMSRVQS